MRTRTLIAFGAGGIGGAVVAHLFDPDRGRARRARLADQSRHQWRELQRDAGRQARYAAGVDEGQRRAATAVPPTGPPPDDATLADKVRSEVLGRADFGNFVIAVDAAAGAVHLRGEVPSDVAERIEAAVERVHGVTSVESFLHPPGTPAPNKARARSASSTPLR
jgi:osmotically-inducible protein OsmY